MKTLMRTEEERIRELHKRAGELRKKREVRRLAGLGSVSAFLVCLLAVSLSRADGLSESIGGSSFAGSSLLSNSAGGYVLAAVMAFFAGVIITAFIFRHRKRQK